jgi:hypothetical protein
VSESIPEVDAAVAQQKDFKTEAFLSICLE